MCGAGGCHCLKIRVPRVFLMGRPSTIKATETLPCIPARGFDGALCVLTPSRGRSDF